MGLNHATIKSTLKAIGITIFAISVALKIRQIILYGGTKPIKPPTDEEPTIENVENIEKTEASREPASYDDYDDYDEDDE